MNKKLIVGLLFLTFSSLVHAIPSSGVTQPERSNMRQIVRGNLGGIRAVQLVQIVIRPGVIPIVTYSEAELRLRQRRRAVRVDDPIAMVQPDLQQNEEEYNDRLNTRIGQ